MRNEGQIRAARGFLNWSQKDLANRSGISHPTIKRMETKGLSSCNFGNVEAVRKALETAGISFREDGCVCPPKAGIIG
jgi:transcriptional regulator with XRE-family HTH domain